MYLVWEDNRPIADAAMTATLFEVSERTVRRHCQAVKYRPRKGLPRGEGGAALYDVFDAAGRLQGVAPRPERTVAVLSYRFRQRRVA
jgi:hypothetical protein